MFDFASIPAFLVVFVLLTNWVLAKVSGHTIKDHGAVLLKAKTSFSNRGLSFSEGKEYTFHYSHGVLICNADDASKWRDNYNFHGADLDNFEPIGAYSRKITKKVKGSGNA